MNPSIPAIVVTVPARSVSDARAQVDDAKAAGADLVEIRFDRFAVSEIERAAELFPSGLPLVATLRSRAEGGEGPDDPVARARILTDLSVHTFRFLDVELDRDMLVAETLRQSGTQGLIVSSHLRAPTSVGEWVRLVRHPVPPGTVRKVVVAASVGQLLSEFLPTLTPAGGAPLVALTTGPSGPLLRSWSRRFGFPFVYASLPESASRVPAERVEPSQIPVDRLAGYLRADGIPPLFAVVGHPVAHSRSPVLHSRWMSADHHIGLYMALDFESEREFVESIPYLVEGGFRGLNVTHPLKVAALELASHVGAGASACGVANTLTLGADEVEAENTDLAAILRRLEELRSSGRWDGSSVGVIGAGGAARATLAAVRSLGAKAHVWARRPEAAEDIAREFGAEPVHDPAKNLPALVVHATPFGRESEGSSPISDVRVWFRSRVHVVDWVYDPMYPALRDSALKSGGTYEDGLRLLVYQAAASYGVWWGDEPSPEQVTSALEATA